MMHGSWDMESDRQNFLSFWTIFCPFRTLKTQKMKTLKKWKGKTPGDIISLHKCTKNHDHILHCSWDRMHDRCNFIFHFGLFFALLPPMPLPPLTTQRIKILRKCKKHLQIASFYTMPCDQKLWKHDAWFLRYGAWQMDGQMEKVTCKGGSPPKTWHTLWSIYSFFSLSVLKEKVLIRHTFY